MEYYRTNISVLHIVDTKIYKFVLVPETLPYQCGITCLNPTLLILTFSEMKPPILFGKHNGGKGGFTNISRRHLNLFIIYGVCDASQLCI